MPNNNNETTTKFKVDISELVKGMQDAKRQMALANAEFKSATAGMDDWSKSADGINAKLSQLDKTLKSQENILGSLEDQYALTVAQMGEGSKEAINLKIKIENQKASIAKTKKEIANYNKSLDNLEKGSEDSADAVEDLGNASKKSSKNVDKLGDSAKKAEGGFTVLKGAVATFAGNVLTSLVSGIGNAVSSLAGLGDSTAEYRQGLNQLETAYGKVGMSAEETYEAFNYFGSVLGDTRKAQETMLMLGQLASSQEELAGWTDTLTGVYATYGEAIPLEGLTEAINHTSQLGEVQGTLADALEWGGISTDEFNAQLSALNSEEERAQLIQNTLNGLYGEAADTYNELNKDILDASTASTNLENAMANMGDVVRPLSTIFTEFKATLINELVPSLDLIKEGLLGMAEGVDGAGEQVSQGISDLVNNVVTKVTSMLPNIVNVGVRLITSLISGIVRALPNVVRSLGRLIPDVIGVIVDMVSEIGDMMPDILNSIVSGIYFILDGLVKLAPKVVKAGIKLFTGLVKALPTIIENLLEMLSDLVTDIVYTLIEAIPELIDGAVQFFSAIIDALPQIIDSLTGWLPLIVETIVDGLVKAVPQLLNGAITLFMAIIKAIPQIITLLVNNLPKIINAVIKALLGAMPQLLEAGITFFMALVDAIPEIVPPLIDAIPQIIEAIVNVLTENFPLLLQTAIDLLMALVRAIPTVCANLLKSIPQIIAAILQALGNLPKLLGDLFEGIWDGIVAIFGDAGKWVYDTIVVPVVDFFSGMWETIKEIFAPVIEFFGGIFESVYNTIKSIVDNIINFFVSAWENIKSIFSVVGQWFYDTVITPIANFFSGMWDNVVNGAKTAWNGIKSVFSKVADFFKSVFTKAWTAVKNVFSVGGKIFTGIKDGIVNGFKTIVNAIIKGINKVVAIPFNAINWALEGIRKVNILGIKPFEWIDLIDVPQIPLLAKGGVIDKPTLAMFGEAGKEAVVPLENNTQWLDEVASRIVEKGGLNGANAQTVNNTYNYEYNQTNNSPKALSRLDIYRQSKNLLGYAGGGV